jgi:acyl carrier protein
MDTTTNPVNFQPSDPMAVVIESIRSVSAKAREAPITAKSLLWDELALDSLDLVAVVLQLQDYFQVEIDPDELPRLIRVEDLVAGLNQLLRAAA